MDVRSDDAQAIAASVVATVIHQRKALRMNGCDLGAYEIAMTRDQIWCLREWQSDRRLGVIAKEPVMLFGLRIAVDDDINEPVVRKRSEVF
jgi:hypothetical protein